MLQITNFEIPILYYIIIQYYSKIITDLHYLMLL